MEPFADVSDYETKMRVVLSADEAASVEQHLEGVSDLFRRRCGQTVWPPQNLTFGWRRLWWVQRLFLPHPPSIPLTVTQVTVDGVPYAGWTLDRTYALVSDDRLGWSGDVEATYTVGFDVPPPSVRDAVLNIASRAWSNPYGVTQETEGPFSRSFGTAAVQGWRSDELELVNHFRAVTV